MAVNFSAQFRINEKTQSRVLRLTDTSTGFTLAKGNFSVTFPDGSTRIKTDFSSPDISAAGGYVDILLVTDNTGAVIAGTYKIDYVALDTSLGGYNLSRTSDFNWIKPTKNIVDGSDVLLPEVKFFDNTSYSPSGSFTGTVSRTFSTIMPSNTPQSGTNVIGVGNLINPIFSGNYYEGVYTAKSDISITYTHATNSWLTLFYTDLLQEIIEVKRAPTQTQLIGLMNTYHANIEAYEKNNDTQFNLLNEQYDLVVALYSHLIARYESNTLDGSEPLLNQLLDILSPYSAHTYTSAPLVPFTLDAIGTTGFIISNGTSSDSLTLGDTLTFSSGSTALVPTIANNNVIYTPTFGTSSNTFASGNDSRFHNAVTLGSSTNGLSLSTQQLSLATATTSNAGSMSSADKVKLDGIASGAQIGTVTSIGISMPSAFTVSNSPVTTSGTIAITAGGLSTEYIQGNGAAANFNSASRNAISLTTTGTSGAATYSSTTGVLNIPQYVGGVTSFNTRTGAITLTSGDVTTALTFVPENSSNKGIAGGYASLDGSGVVPSTQLPSYVDDVLEFADLASLPVTGSTGKIYVALDTNKIYRWSGTVYVEVSPTAGTIWGGISGTVSNQTDLQTALNAKQSTITLTTTGTSGAATFIGNTLNIPQYVGGVTSFNTRTGAITLSSTDVTTALTFTPYNATNPSAFIALTALSAGTGISYNNTTGVISSTITQYTDALSRAAISLTTTGTSGAATYNSSTGVLNIPEYQGGVTSFNTRTGAITLTSSDVTTALTFTPYNATNPNAYIALTALSAGTGISYNNTTGVITNTITQYTDALARAAISLTTTGTSGAATYNSSTGVLNIPEYQGGVTSFNTRTGAVTLSSGDVTGALGFTPYNATNPSNYIALTALSSTATGLTYTNTTGVFSLTTGYAIPTTAKQANWDDAYTWISGFPTQTSNGGKYLTTDGSTLSWGSISASGVTSFNTRTGAITLTSGDVTTALTYTPYPTPAGDTTQYIAGDGSLISFPVAGQSGTLVRQVRNTTGATLTKGTVVYISGASGNKPTVSKAIATGDSTSAQTFGLVQANISNNSNGYVVCVGDIIGLDTSAFAEGVQLYLSSTTAGTYTSTKQLAPNHLVYIGVVTRSHPTQGEIEVKIQNGYELDELHDVAAQTPSNNDGLFYESSTNLWKNKSITTVLGYTPYDAANPSNYIALTALSSTATGLTYTNTTGVFSLTSGYVIPTTTSATNWDTAYGWGNHASAGYLTASSAASTYQQSDADLTAIAAISGTSGLLKKTAANTWGLDTNAYLTSITSGDVTTALGYTPVTNARTLTINGTALDLSANRSWTISAGTTLDGTGFVRMAGTTASYITGTSSQFVKADGTLDSSTYLTASTVLNTVLTPYTVGANTAVSATDTIETAIEKLQGQVNARGTGNGTVTSVGGTGTVSGLTLTGTVTSSGSLTLGGTLSLTSGNVTTALGFTPVALSSAITGYSVGSNTALAATDTILGAFNKIQGQINARLTSYSETSTLANVTARGATTNAAITVNGDLTVRGAGSSSSIFMSDDDEGARMIHCNSNRIGFLTQSQNWGSYCNDDGSWVSVSDITAYSDRRVKENVETITNALSKVTALRGVSYNRIDDSNKVTKIGVIAQETQEIVPEVVTLQNDGMLSVSYGNMSGLFIEAFKEQQVQLMQQKAQIDELMEIVKTLKGL